MIEINKIYQEPCLNTVARMDDNSIDCVITSPPYWQLRDYGYEGQWGLEPTYQEYLENLWSLMDAIYPKLKDGGTVWVNLGDTYMNNSSYCEKGRQGFGKDKIGMLYKSADDIKQKSLVLIPHRFAIGCIDRGWIVRNDIIWAKRNGMPESIEFYANELKDAEKTHKLLKENKELRAHSYSLTYAKKAVNDLKKKYETAVKLWK